MQDTSRWGSPNKCTAGYSGGPHSIVVQQVLGEKATQQSVDIHVKLPRGKPAIEQIIDVMVKKLQITSVDVIPNKVIVRGEFEVKALYVACRPRQPVHAVEVWPVRFTAFVDIIGARRGMEAEASVIVEFVDYDYEEHTRAQWHKKKGQWHDKYEHHDQCDCSDDCEEDYDCDCEESCDCEDDCKHTCKPFSKHKCKHKCKPFKKHRKGTRKFDVSVVLKIVVKVLTDREVIIYSGLPTKPKG